MLWLYRWPWQYTCILQIYPVSELLDFTVQITGMQHNLMPNDTARWKPEMLWIIQNSCLDLCASAFGKGEEVCGIRGGCETWSEGGKDKRIFGSSNEKPSLERRREEEEYKNVNRERCGSMEEGPRFLEKEGDFIIFLTDDFGFSRLFWFLPYSFLVL